MNDFAGDIAWLLQHRGIQGAVLIGHSMGGAVALETAYRHPHLVRAVVMIDTAFQPAPALAEELAPLLLALAGETYEEAYRTIMRTLSRPEEEDALAEVLDTLPAASQPVLLSALHAHMEEHDFAAAAAACSARQPTSLHPVSLPTGRSLRGSSRIWCMDRLWPRDTWRPGWCRIR